MKSLKLNDWCARNIDKDSFAYKGVIDFAYNHKPEGYEFYFIRRNWTRCYHPEISSITIFYRKKFK